MESVQATPKYDLVKKRFMSATSNEESISPLIKALQRLGHRNGSGSLSSLSLAANSRKDFDGYLTTIEFLENCMHSQKYTQNGLKGSEVEHEEFSEVSTQRRRQKSIDWNEAKDAVKQFSAKATATTKRNTIVIHVIVSNQENNLRRLKWLLKMRFFAEVGKVDKVVIVPSNTESYSVLVEDDTLQTGFAFVMFESEAVADKALAASHDFPWPVRGRFNQETNTFERMRYHRCHAQNLACLEDTLTQQPMEQCATSVQMSRESLMSTADLLAGELRALQSSLHSDSRVDGHTTESENELLVYAGSSAKGEDNKSCKDPSGLCEDKKYSPGTKSKIAALLRKSIQEVRLSSVPQADSPARNAATIVVSADIVEEESRSPPSKGASLSSAEKLLQKIRCVMESLNVDTPSSTTSTTTKKVLQHSEIEKHLKVSARTGDLYEVIGWYQEKIKLMQYGTSTASVGSRTGRTNTRSTGSDTSVSWTSLQTFLDSLKAEVRVDRDLSTAKSSAKELKTVLPTDEQNCVRLRCALDALALLLLAEQMNHEHSTADTLKATILAQQDMIEQTEQRAESLSERLTDARERVREYSHEIAELEQENRVLSETAVRYELVRDQLFEAKGLLAEQERRLSNRDSELRVAHASNVQLRQEVEDLRRENSRLLHAQQHQPQFQERPSQLTAHAPSFSAHTRTNSHRHRSHNNYNDHHVLIDSNSDADSEQESKAKAAHAQHRNPYTSASTSASSGRISARGESQSKAEPAQSLRAQVSQLTSATTSDWIQLYLTRSSTLDELQATETELAGIKGDLTAILSKFDLAKKELHVCFHAKRGQLAQQAQEKKVEMADQNLCCICLENPKSVLLMPCRHLCVCQVCSEGAPESESPLRASRSQREKRVKNIHSCPVCRATVDECLKVFS